MNTIKHLLLLTTIISTFVYQDNCSKGGGKTTVSNQPVASAPATDGVKPGVAKSFAPFCPSGNGLFVLYYGTRPENYARIIAEKPNFVVSPQESNDPVTAKLFKDAGVRALIYVSMTYEREVAAKKLKEQGEAELAKKVLDHSCALIKTGTDIDTEIMLAIDNGFSGIFFDCARLNLDDTEAKMFNAALIKSLAAQNKTIHDWNRDRSNLLRAKNSEALIIMNPGVATVDDKMFEYADIVSVENRWDRLVTTTSGNKIPAWRWYAVSGDPAKDAAKDAQEAIERLDTFRKNGGSWYYSPPKGSGDATHSELMKDKEFKKFAAYARGSQIQCNNN